MNHRRHEGSGFAVRIYPSKLIPSAVGWLNNVGGYHAYRRERYVWPTRIEADEAARAWGGCHPEVIKVHFYVRTATLLPSEGRER